MSKTGENMTYAKPTGCKKSLEHKEIKNVAFL